MVGTRRAALTHASIHSYRTIIEATSRPASKRAFVTRSSLANNVHSRRSSVRAGATQARVTRHSPNGPVRIHHHVCHTLSEPGHRTHATP